MCGWDKSKDLSITIELRDRPSQFIENKPNQSLASQNAP